jgi:hypothetical protein
MFRKILMSLAFVCASVAYAGDKTTLDTSGLTDAQIAELKAVAAKKVSDVANKAVEPLTPKDPGAMLALASTWGPQMAQAAEGFARALGIAAKELNITVNDFLASPAGKLTAAVILWKVAGTAVLKLLYGLFFITVGLSITRMIYTRLFTKGYEKVEYKHYGGWSTGTKLVRIPKTIADLHNDGEWLAFWTMIVVCVATLGFGAAIVI